MSLKTRLPHVPLGLILCAVPPQLSAAIQILAVTHATNFAIGFPAPGSFATVFCTGLKEVDGVIGAQGAPLPPQLAGVGVSIDGKTAPIAAVAGLGGYQQINFQIPWEVAVPASSVTVTQGQESARVPIPATSSSWPVFFIGSDGYAVAQHNSDYQLVTPSRPARPGEWIIAYASNLGPVVNTPPTGAATPLAPLSPLAPVPLPQSAGPADYSLVLAAPDQPVSYFTERSESNYIGLTPGAVGVYQINFRIPEHPPAGDGIIYLRRNVDCGFFFLQGCGRSLTSTFSLGARLPISQ